MDWTASHLWIPIVEVSICDKSESSTSSESKASHAAENMEPSIAILPLHSKSSLEKSLQL